MSATELSDNYTHLLLQISQQVTQTCFINNYKEQEREEREFDGAGAVSQRDFKQKPKGNPHNTKCLVNESLDQKECVRNCKGVL